MKCTNYGNEDKKVVNKKENNNILKVYAIIVSGVAVVSSVVALYYIDKSGKLARIMKEKDNQIKALKSTVISWKSESLRYGSPKGGKALSAMRKNNLIA